MFLPIILQEEGDVLDLKDEGKEDQDQDIGKLFNKAGSGFENNVAYRKRLIDVIDEFIRDGVF